MRNVCGSLGLLFLIIDGILSMYISDNKTIPEKVCDTMPANTGISCTEFIIPDQSYCTEEKLGKLFPNLYDINNPSGTEWPGPIQYNKPNGSTQTWGVPQDGSINYLRGFQVIQLGMDTFSFGLKKCSVFDISDNKEEDLRHLMETTFVINLSGTFRVEIKSLPIAPVKVASHQPDIVVHPNQGQPVYQPELSVLVQYYQLNDSTVNISVEVSPEIKNLTSMYIDIKYSNGSILQNKPDSFEISQKSFILHGFSAGSYIIKLTPVDPYVITADYDENCICFYDDRFCVPCEGYYTNINITQSVTQRDNVSPTGDGNTSILTFVLAPVIVIGLAMIVLVVVCRVFVRNNKLPTCFNTTRFFNRAGTSFTDDSEDKRPKLQIMYTNDHIHHKTVIGNLATLLKNSTEYEVIIDCSPIREIKNISDGSLYAPEMVSFQGRQCNNADVIILVHSEWAYKLKSVIESGDVSIIDVIDAEDRSFLLCINEIFQRPTVTSKLVSIRFEYTPESSVIKEPFLGPHFTLPSNIEALVKHLSSKVGKQQQATDILGTNSDDKMSMFTAINATFTYHSKHKTWLFTKLFNLKNSSSDDSGVVVQRPRYLRSRSIRSRSADTIPHPVCTCDTNSGQRSCLQHFQKPSVRQRTYSCDLSFYPPESITDEISERYSLLENKFSRINSRYKKILNNQIDDSDEYITLDEISL